jgi:hypothetical protein
MVAKIAEQGHDKKNILSALTTKNPNRPVILKDVHNIVQKLNRQNRIGNTTMQRLENALVGKNFTFYTSENRTTNDVENIFFTHELSWKMWCAFPHVVILDATYKTNMYMLPFVQLVGMTSTNQTFCIAHAFISAEKVENYVWVLERLKSLLVPGMEPSVIVTDRELSLVRACDKVFPEVKHNLCRFHVQQNIDRQLPKDKDTLGKKPRKHIHSLFGTVCKSPTEDLYRINLDTLEQYMNSIHLSSEYSIYNLLLYFIRYNLFRYTDTCVVVFSEIFQYIMESWMNPYKEKLVNAWTSKSYNFNQNTTNRVEGAHAQFKSYLKGNRNSLVELVVFVDQLVNKQWTSIKSKFEDSLRKQMNVHRSQLLLAGLILKVSHYALDLLMVEIDRMKEMSKSFKEACGCRLFTGMGLPCACRLAQLKRKGNE